MARWEAQGWRRTGPFGPPYRPPETTRVLTTFPAVSVRTVQDVLGEGGDILAQTLDTAGQVLSSDVVGNLLDLQLLGETTNAAGQTVRRVMDTTGAILEYTLDTAGRATNIRLLQEGTGAGLPED